uniref:Ubiquitin like 4A n=1 Tax=Sphenodon punctatus TaxID=8508 RepID=A0A8D0HSR5_SPHPU
MLLTVKALQGRECSLQVGGGERGAGVCVWGSSQLLLPPPDEHRLCDYAIGPESKLNLVIKPSEKGSPEEPPRWPGPPHLPAGWHPLAQVLVRHFGTADAEKVLEQMLKDYERSLRLLSLDDIERLATRLLHPEVAEAMELSFLD